MCVRVERELALRRAERQARWAAAEPGLRARRWWSRLRRRPTTRVTDTHGAGPVPADRKRQQPAAAGGAER
jgi:hypothetical protein